MMEDNKVDLGSIHVHNKVLADITYSVLKDIRGVRLASHDLLGKMGEIFGKKSYPGIEVHVDKANQVTIAIRVSVQYGLNIPDVAREIQDQVRSAIEKTVDIDLKDINVNIHGIERGE